MALTLIRPTKPPCCYRELPDGAHAYPAYKTTVLPSGNAGWRCAYPAYKTTVLLSGIAGWRCAYPAYKIVVLLSGNAGWR
ncbi:hypothetical protein [Kosakonia sp. 1610]|uniref:hypothetical protein n=1 Tax=Kosakonia sp. 1610 TaxID=3156426 RepID=UPI003D1C65DF